jgi:1-acyl-sn-glycerol-3-phosphate acyltransferase
VRTTQNIDHVYSLPGGRIGTDRLNRLPDIAVRAAWIMGPATLPVRRALRSRGSSAARLELAGLARRVLHTLKVRLKLTGLERIDGNQAYVVVPLHEGLLDPAVVLQLPLPMVFATRSEFFDWRVVGGLLERTGQMAVDPERPRAGYRELLEQAPRHLAEGTSVTIFPQGSVLGIETAFQPAAFDIAHRCGVPILPVVITGTHRVWEYPFSPRVRTRADVHAEVMAPIVIEDITAEVRRLQREMKQAALSTTPGPRRYVPERDGWWDDYPFDIDPDYPELADRVASHRRRQQQEGQTAASQ